ncbi:hypothetical protein AGMMS50293_07410 [Spirochaetia bacterium]|nr:hypothetical protein AGMMS50293_07410 [Spirochaetia bacterium]
MKIPKVVLASRITVKRFCFLCFLALAAAAGAQEQRAVMIRGNEWQTGIPGFGNNVFQSLFGEYEVESGIRPQSGQAGHTVQGVFSVRVCAEEPLVFAEGLWQPRPGLGPAVQRQDGDSLLVSIPYSNQNIAGSWIILFQFPRALTEAGFNDAAANRLIRSWTDRFGYFLSLIKNFADISLPAVVNF